MSQEVYFDNIKSIIKFELQKATDFIYIAVAWFTDKELFDKLIELSQKGINIQLIVNDDVINNNSGIDYNLLYKNGGLLYFLQDQDHLMHNKFCVIDNRMLINGSYNWTNKAKTNHENIILSTDVELCKKFIDQFNRIRRVAKKHNILSEEEMLKEIDVDKPSMLGFEELIIRAKKRKKNGNYHACMIDLQTALRLNPEKKELFLYDLAYCQLKLNNFRESISNFTILLETKPNFSDALNNRGLAYQQLKEYRLAIEDISKAIELCPTNTRYYLNRASVQYELVDYYEDRSLRPRKGFLEPVFLKDDPQKKIYEIEKEKEMFFWFGSNLKKLLYRSVNDYLFFIKHNTGCGNELFYLPIAIIYLSICEPKKSIIYCSKAIEFNPNDNIAFCFRSFANYELNNFIEALNDINTALKLNPNDSKLKDQKAIIEKRIKTNKE